MLIFPLKNEWFDKIKSGEKTIVYCEVKPYWRQRIKKILPPCFYSDMKKIVSTLKCEKLSVSYDKYDRPACLLRKGYTNSCLIARIKKIEIINGKNTDLHIDRLVYAFHLSNVKEA